MQTVSQIRREYFIGMISSMTFYCFMLFASVFYLKNNDASNWLKITMALLTSLPIGASIYVFIRYLKNCDEFLRAILSEIFIISTGITLFLSATWGFLENFANFPHFDLFWVYVVFWGVFGIVSATKKVCHL